MLLDDLPSIAIGGYFLNILMGWDSQFVGHNGGTEKVFSNFSNEMVKRGHNVTMVYCTEKTGALYTPLDSRVILINIANYLPGGKWESVKPLTFKIKREILRIINKVQMHDFVENFELTYRASAIKEILDQVHPDIIISFSAISTALFLIYNRSIPIITMSHFNAEQILEGISIIEKNALIHSDVVQVLMPHDLLVFQRALPKVRLVHIPNIVPQYGTVDSMEERENVIIDVARLEVKQKRQHLLIEAFAQIAKKYPTWKVELWGSEQGGNSYTTALRKLIEKYGLEHRVLLKGNAANVISVYRKASIFAFPSAYEGFPLAMTEAMSAELPVVAFQSCPGVNELIVNQRNGLLVGDTVDDFAAGLEVLIRNKGLRERLGTQANQDMKVYSAESIWNQWEQLMKHVIEVHSRDTK